MEGKKVKISVKAGAKSDPELTAKLGANQISPKMFFDRFNEEMDKLNTNTNQIEAGVLYNVKAFVKEKNNFDLKICGPVVASRIKQLTGQQKGASKPNLETVGTITNEQIEKIAKEKLMFSNTNDLEKMKKTIISTAKAMGVQCQ